MATVVRPPTPLPEKRQSEISVYLAGGNGTGLSNDWREMVNHRLHDQDVLIFDPHRGDLDLSNPDRRDPLRVRSQVEWELAALERASFIALYLDSHAKSFLDLLEFGLFHAKTIVYCPEGSCAKGDLDIVCIVCNRYVVAHVDSLELFLGTIVRNVYVHRMYGNSLLI